MSIHVIKPGALSTLQDLGRFGYQSFGVSVSGAMDQWTHRVANLLVGNAQTEATLEFTLIGPSLVFDDAQLIAIYGADMSPTIDRQAVPQGQPVLVRAGSRLDFGKRVSGARAYLSIRGGFPAAAVMGSKSTFLRGAFGGFGGRALRKGDEIAVNAAEPCDPRLVRMLDERDMPFAVLSEAAVPALAVATPQVLRVTTGPQWDAFSCEAQAAFTNELFRISLQSDRMGYRLEGARLALRQPLEMISEGVIFGAVQVPPDGNPIVLMADCQTTGGYPKIAYVASVDLPLLAQMRPNEHVRFAPISMDQAQQLYIEREDEIERVRAMCAEPVSSDLILARLGPG